MAGAPTIDLYGSISPNVQKIILALEEAGVAHRFIEVNVHRGEQFTEAFRALNPMCKVPVIVDHEGADGRPITVFESGAILIYLAEKYGVLLPRDQRARFDALQWMMVQMSAIGPTWGQFNHFVRYAADDHYGVVRFTTAARALYDKLEERLTVSPWLGGEEYSLADVATYPWVRVESRLFGETHGHMHVHAPGHPALTDWCKRIEARPAVQRALRQIDGMRSNRGTGTQEQEDRLAGRGAFTLSLD